MPLWYRCTLSFRKMATPASRPLEALAVVVAVDSPAELECYRVLQCLLSPSELCADAGPARRLIPGRTVYVIGLPRPVSEERPAYLTTPAAPSHLLPPY